MDSSEQKGYDWLLHGERRMLTSSLADALDDANALFDPNVADEEKSTNHATLATFAQESTRYTCGSWERQSFVATEDPCTCTFKTFECKELALSCSAA